MNSQEREALVLFLQQMNRAQAGQKDPEAEAMINAAISRQPDAGYLLVQRSMQLDILLQQAQTKLTEMQAELDLLKKTAATSFLGDVHAWGRAPSSPAASTTPAGGVPSATATGPAPVNQTLRASGQPATPAAQAAPAPSSWGSGLLGTVATTAAGVVAGSFLYHGIQNLMGNSGAGAQQAGRDASPPDWNHSQDSPHGAVQTAYVDTGSGYDTVSEADTGEDGGASDGGGSDGGGSDGGGDGE